MLYLAKKIILKTVYKKIIFSSSLVANMNIISLVFYYYRR